MPNQTEILIQEVLALHRLQDECALTQVALIRTLGELLPGFSDKFAEYRIVAEKVMSPENEREYVRVQEAFRKAKM
jgi:hypothetical protein